LTPCGIFFERPILHCTMSKPKLTLHADGKTEEVAFAPGCSLRDILNTTDIRIRSACRGNGACGLCLIRIDAGELPPPKLAEKLHLSDEQLASGQRLACQIHPEADLRVTLINIAPPSAWRSLTEVEYTSRFSVGQHTHRGLRFGVAIDLGTTHISLAFCDLRNGRRLALRYGPNPQAAEGSDILNRLIAAQESSETALHLQTLVVDAIGDGLLDISSREALSLHDVARVAIVGNTAMLTILAGNDPAPLLEPAHWTEPFHCELPADVASWREKWNLLPDTPIELVQPMAGFIGSDLAVGLLHAQAHRSQGPSLFLDFGTNTEMALWTGQRFLLTSTAGGPAFEGMGISCGMAAEPGAIIHVNNTPEGAWRYEVLAGKQAIGLCGPALVDLLALLRASDTLDEMGRFRDGASLFELPDTNFHLSRQDVDMLQRAKAAIAAGFELLLARAGLTVDQLVNVVVAGAFGRDLDAVNAIAIGLLPQVSADEIRLLGNTALKGCQDWLVSENARQELESIRSLSNVLNLSKDEAFEECFLHHLYLCACNELPANPEHNQTETGCNLQDAVFCFGAFIHASQYLASLLPDADINQAAVDLCTGIFKSDCAGIYRVTGLQTQLQCASHPAIYAALADELELGLQQVLDTGFLAVEDYQLEIGQAEFVFLPILSQGKLSMILSVGFTNQETPSHELLDALLGVAGLLGAAIAHKEARTLMENYRLELETQVKQRTAELDSARLNAEAANRAKSVFLSNMSHELRTPLNAILGFTQIMEMDKRIPEEQRRNIEIINRSGRHLLALINDVLEISRIESGRTRVNTEIFDLQASIQTVLEMIRVRAEAKGLRVLIDCSPDLPNCVLGDEHHLRQILINLLGNAVKYTDNGHVSLCVRPEADQKVLFEIADTGPGIAADQQEHIFHAFYQTEDGIAKGEGTGLGLTISREFVQLLGGELKLESRLGHGSTFSFAIPLPSSDARAPTEATELAAPGEIISLKPGQPSPRILRKRLAIPPVKNIRPAASCDFLIRRSHGHHIEMVSAY